MFIRIKSTLLLLIVIFLQGALAQATAGDNLDHQRVSLSDDGRLALWLVAGPFEQPIVGFGEIGDRDAIGEEGIKPFEGKIEQSALNEHGQCRWFVQSADEQGYLDFNALLGWFNPGKIPAKIRQAKAAYAFTNIESARSTEALLLLGSNAGIKVFLNQRMVYDQPQRQSAKPDEDTLRISLQKGVNTLLIKVWNSHYNYYLPFFNGIDWGWGFYARLLNPENEAPPDVNIFLPTARKNASSFSVQSTFFFRETNHGLEQRCELWIDSRQRQIQSALLTFKLEGKDYRFDFSDVPFGKSRHCFYIPELKSPAVSVKAMLKLGDRQLKQTIQMKQQPKYDLHVMMLAHMDLGYTHPQPIVIEKHLQTLDAVVEQCLKDDQFYWTIETVWILEQYEQGRPAAQFNQLIDLIKQGRIALSPLYSNPFSGWIGEGEWLRSLDKAAEYRDRYGLDVQAAVYNDVPGLNWSLPQLLTGSGINFLACGINEFYSDYILQKSIPKVYYWQGNDGSRLLTYRNEAYDEGRHLGLEKSPDAIEHRLHERLHILQAWGYPYDVVLINTSFLDNAGIPYDQYAGLKTWNERFAYPRFVVSNLNRFAEAFTAQYAADLPVIAGDWTSDWDILYQGEAQSHVTMRQTQARLLTAEKLSTLTWLLDPNQQPLEQDIAGAYQGLLMFSGHGSGLEAGLGTPQENAWTMAYRRQEIATADLFSTAAALRGLHRLASPEEAWAQEGVLVFNPLSWKRDAPLEIQFNQPITNTYELIDLVSGKQSATFSRGQHLYALVRDLPPLGYKKFLLNRLDANVLPDNGLRLKTNQIENEFYQIAFLAGTGEGGLLELYEKTTGRNLLRKSSRFPFHQPLREVLFGASYQPMDTPTGQVSIVDERPVRLIISVHYPGQLFEEIRYMLWAGLNRIDMQVVIDPQRLESPAQTESYGFPFTFQLDNSRVAVEILGGFLDPSSDRFPGMQKESFSIRRVISLFNAGYSIDLASPQARVFQLRRETENSAPVMIANVINNFPEHWNRRDESEGKLELDFSIRARQGKFQEAEAARFGWESAAPPMVARSMYRTENARKSYFQLSDDAIQLVTLSAGQEAGRCIAVFQNMEGQKASRAEFSSDYFIFKEAVKIDPLGRRGQSIPIRDNRFEIQLKANETGRYGLIIK